MASDLVAEVLAFLVRIENTVGVAIGRPMRQVRFEDPVGLLGDRLRGVYRLLADHGAVLFPEDYFADMFTRSRKGRSMRSPPPATSGSA